MSVPPMNDSNDEPEVWITGDRVPGNGDRHGPGRWRWLALLAGLVVLVAVIAVQHHAGGGNRADSGLTTGEPSTAVSDTLSPSHTPSRRSAPTGSTPTAPSQAATASLDQTPRAESTNPPPRTTVAATAGLPGDGGWELLGLTAGPQSGSVIPAVVRYQPHTGKVTTTMLPSLDSNGPLAFVVTRDAAIVRPYDAVDGYLAADGRPATILTGLLARSSGAWPGPDDTTVWAYLQQGQHGRLAVTDAHGRETGTWTELPDMLAASGGSYALRPDGNGGVLAQGLGGAYEVTADGVRRITYGTVLAVGPAALVTYDCTDEAVCSAHALDRDTEKRRPVDGLGPDVGNFGFGVTSPDGSHAAIVEGTGMQPTPELIDLGTSHVHHIEVRLQNSALGFASPGQLAFTPDGRYLLIAGHDGVHVIDASTAKDLGTLPVEPLAAIAVRTVRASSTGPAATADAGQR